jgi:XTP/dITP diphosphohydrolase
MDKTIVIATANRGKAEELKEIFAGSGFAPKFLFDFPELANLLIQENAKSFEGNALIKAIIVGDILHLITLADDSGLCVDALNGGPGVLSARYSGLGTDEANNQKLLEDMINVPAEKRGGHYHCAVAIYDPVTKFVETAQGEWPGRIAFTPRGNKSFGYGPVFLAENFNYEKTNAEFDPQELIAINHRGQAFRKAIDILRTYLNSSAGQSVA